MLENTRGFFLHFLNSANRLISRTPRFKLPDLMSDSAEVCVLFHKLIAEKPTFGNNYFQDDLGKTA
jgi:hypothetical protein